MSSNNSSVPEHYDLYENQNMVIGVIGDVVGHGNWIFIFNGLQQTIETNRGMIGFSFLIWVFVSYMAYRYILNLQGKHIFIQHMTQVFVVSTDGIISDFTKIGSKWRMTADEEEDELDEVVIEKANPSNLRQNVERQQ